LEIFPHYRAGVYRLCFQGGQKERRWPLTAASTSQTSYGALVALQHCHILHISKAFIGYPKNEHGKQATAKMIFSLARLGD